MTSLDSKLLEILKDVGFKRANQWLTEAELKYDFISSPVERMQAVTEYICEKYDQQRRRTHHE